MTDEPTPPARIIDNAQLMMRVLTAYKHHDEGLTSERELHNAVTSVLAEADPALLVTALAHSTIQLMKHKALTQGQTLSQALQDAEAELRAFTDPPPPA